MEQILIVSNRLPINVKKVNSKLEFHPSIGGLATGLSSYVENRKSLWIGWPGIAKEELNEQEKQIITDELLKHHCSPVFLSKRQVDEFYNGYSNSILWPIFHTMPFVQSVKQERWWKAYREVNKLFADTVLSLAQPNSTIWVHDYQLLLLPELLRSERTGDHIGFFLHIPFPRIKTFNKIKQAKQLLKGMVGADLVGFHTTTYCDQFIMACQTLDIGIAGQQQVILSDHNTQVLKLPIGVDYEKYEQANKLKTVKAAVKRYQQKYGKRKVIVAIDRLEPSKGLDKRLEAYRDFLALNRKLHNKVILVMVAAPSRMDLPAYQRLTIRLKKLSSEINSTYGTPSWQPVDFINESLPFEEVNALYQLADIAFIAPLQDGMNLVAKEYVASRHKSGVLILSQTAGAAEELSDALLVDPRKPAKLIEALQQAFTLPNRELRSRLHSMKKQIATNTIQSWATTFVSVLQKPVIGSQLRTRSLQGNYLKGLINAYHRSKKRLLILDYDGSLVPFIKDFKAAKPTKALVEQLRRLASDSANVIVLMSGRQASDLDAWFGNLNVHLAAEHGAVIKKAGAKSWHTIEHMKYNWMKAALPIIEKYSAMTPRAVIETKPHSLVWHYRTAPPYYAQKYSVTIKRALKPLLKKYGVEIYQGNKILEIKDPRINKGAALQQWLKANYTFVLAIGDDYTDEDVFLRFNDSSSTYSIKVGRGHTAARYRLKTPTEVSKLLSRLLR